MRVLHVIDSAGVWGAERMLLELSRLQRSKGIEAVVLSMGKPADKKKALEVSLEKFQVPFVRFRSRVVPSLQDLNRLLKTVTAVAPDIIHSHGFKGNILFGLLLRRWTSVPIVATLHGWVALPGSVSKLRLYESIDALALRRLDAVVLVAERLKQHTRMRALLRSRGTNVRVIENGISEVQPDLGLPLPEHVERFLSNGDLVGSVGRLSSEKGYSYLLQAIAKLVPEYPRIRLLLVGEGRLRADLERMISEMSLSERVLIANYLDEASRVSARVQIYVCSSLSEGLPITLLEAMRAGTPIVATAVGGIPALLNDGEGGVLVEPGNPDALAEGIRRVLSDRASATRRAMVAKGVFRERYSSESMFHGYAALYLEVLRKRASSGSMAKSD
jgi:glycosyltransferase involved in cell wall biosynthesis